MTDRDRDLQDAFNRYLRGEGPPPETDNDPEAAAYKAVYAALSQEPAGDLPDDFAEQVAERVGLSSEPEMGWVEVLLVLLIIAGAGAGLVWMPPTLAGLQRGLGDLLMSLQDVSSPFRLDIILVTLLVLISTLGFDALVDRLRPGHQSRSA